MTQATSTSAPDQTAEIQQSLTALHRPGDVFEIRALNVKSGKWTNTISGYFNDIERAAAEIRKLDTTRHPPGTYTTINNVNPALLARANNRLVERPKHSTADEDIVRRRWLPFDIDPHRPAGVAATSDEVDVAVALAADVEDLLRGRGWPTPLLVNSGNGMYLLYRIDLPNDHESLATIKNIYKAVNHLLGPVEVSGLHAEIDTTVGNAARILRVGNTMNRKGDAIPERPHRVCEYHLTDEPIQEVSADLLKSLAAEAPKPESNANGSHSPRGGHHHAPRGSGSLGRLQVENYLRDNSIEFTTKTDQNRAIYRVMCPFGDHGSNNETAVIQGSDGLLCFECKHNSCQGKVWRDYRDAVGTPRPEHYDNYVPNNVSTNNANNAGTTDTGSGEPPEQTAPPRFTETLLTSEQFARANYRQEFIVNEVLVAGQHAVLGGRSKVCKTGVAIDMVVSLGSGSPFLGHFATKKCRVGFWSGESGGATVQAKALRCAESRGVDLAQCSVFWSFDLPKLGRLDHIDAMADVVQRHSLDVVLVDPLYLSLLDGSESGKPSDLFFMGSKLLPLSEMGQATGCTFILLHHFRKSRGDDASDEQVALEELSQAGIGEWARQWLLLARRSPYEHDGKHELWMRCGGSSGHAGLYGLSIDEGTIDEHFDGRTWQTDVESAPSVFESSQQRKKQEQAERQREEDDEGQKAIIEAMSRRLARGEGTFLTGLYTYTGIGKDRLRRLLVPLCDQGIVEPCEGYRSPTHKQRQSGAYRLTEWWWQNE